MSNLGFSLRYAFWVVTSQARSPGGPRAGVFGHLLRIPAVMVWPLELDPTGHWPIVASANDRFSPYRSDISYPPLSRTSQTGRMPPMFTGFDE